MKILSVCQRVLFTSLMTTVFTMGQVAHAQPPVATDSVPATEVAPALPAAMTFRLQSENPVAVRARVDGIVKQIHLHPEASVAPNTPVLELDASRLEQQREPLKSAFLESYQSLRLTRKGNDALATAEAEARAQSDASAYDILLFDIAQYQCRTPIGGQLSSINVKAGEFVRQGETVAEILDTSRFTVDVLLRSGKGQLGDHVAVIINGKLVDGTIEQLEPLSGEQNAAARLGEQLVTATLAIKNNGQLQQGQSVIPVQQLYANVPTKSLGTAGDGSPLLRVMRGTETIEIPAVLLSALKEGQQVVMAKLEPGDLAVVPGQLANIPQTEPLTDFSPADSSQLASTQSLATGNSSLLEQFPAASPAASGEDAAAVDTPISLADMNVPPGLAAILAPDQLPLPDLKLDPLLSEIKLSPSDLLAIEQLRTEFQAMLDEKGLHIKELADLKDIEGIAEYEQFLVAIRTINQDYAQQLLHELPEEASSELQTSLLENVGLNAIPENVLEVDEQKIAQIQKQFEAEQFDVVKKLLTSEATIDQARETIKGLLDKKDQAAIDAVSADAKNALAVNMQQRQARFNALIAKPQPEKTPGTVQANPADNVSGPPSKTSLPKFVPPPLKADVDYLMVGMFVVIGLLAVGGLGYFLGLFKLIKSLMTRSPSDKKSRKRKDKLKHVHRVEVGADKTYQTIRDALTAVRENPYVKDEIPWDRHEIVIQPGIYKETIHLDENDPAGIRIMSENMGQVTIVGDGTHPVIEASALTDFGLEGLVIDGDAAPTVIQLRDVQKLAFFSQIIITGFKQFGVRVSSRGGEGELKVSMSETVFLSSMLETTGMFIDYGNLESSTLEMEKSRFHGQMQVGLQFRAPLHKTLIRESIFAYLGTAISMPGTGYPFELLKLSNNTFYRCGKCLFFRRIDALTKGTREVLLDNNLFSQSESADAAVSDVIEADVVEEVSNFLHEHSNGNLTDRADESDFTAGVISLNGKAARVFGDFKFRSVEIDEPDFLMPTPDSPQRQAWAKKGLHRYVGALGPKSVVRSVMETQS